MSKKKYRETEIDKAELTDTEKEFIEASLKFAPPNSKVVKVENDGYSYFRIGELNIDKAARLFYEMLKERGEI